MVLQHLLYHHYTWNVTDKLKLSACRCVLIMYCMYCEPATPETEVNFSAKPTCCTLVEARTTVQQPSNLLCANGERPNDGCVRVRPNVCFLQLADQKVLLKLGKYDETRWLLRVKKGVLKGKGRITTKERAAVVQSKISGSRNMCSVLHSVCFSRSSTAIRPFPLFTRFFTRSSCVVLSHFPNFGAAAC